MHALVDRQLARTAGGAVINVGMYHAQKQRQDGTIDVWLAERLATTSPHARGATYALAVVPASGEMRIRGRVRAFDVGDTSPPNELLRVMQDVAKDAYAFLSLDDPLFAEERVVFTFHPDLHVGPPKAVVDGYVLLPEVGYLGR